CSARSRFAVRKRSHQFQPPREIVTMNFRSALSRKESLLRDDGPGKCLSRSRLDGFNRGQILMREIQKLSRMRMSDLRNFLSMLPDALPTFAGVRDSRRRAKIHAQNLVLDENETYFAHFG